LGLYVEGYVTELDLDPSARGVFALTPAGSRVLNT
jgi:hypothetical protein